MRGRARPADDALDVLKNGQRQEFVGGDAAAARAARVVDQPRLHGGLRPDELAVDIEQPRGFVVGERHVISWD